MTNRASSITGTRLGFVLMGLLVTAVLARAEDCTTCHESHDKYPHPANIAKPACVTCHDAQAVDYSKSAHGLARKSGNEGTPDCALCHGSAHELLSPKSQAFRMAVPDTCGMCHSEVVDQFRASVHGQALARGIM